MGMSSSQARLLSLTSRIHDIEYKAQKLEAQKLQMANESNHVYKEYENALNMTKIQGLVFASDGNTKFNDMNLIALENNEFGRALIIKNLDNNKIYISQSKATEYNLSSNGINSLEEFMTNAGFSTIVTDYALVKNTSPSITFTNVGNLVSDSVTRIVPNIAPEIGYQSYEPNAIPSDAIMLSNVSSTDNFDNTKIYVISTKEDLIKLKTMTNSGKNTQNVNFILSNDIDMSGINWDGIGKSGKEFKGIFDGNGYIINNLSGNAGLFQYVKGDVSISITDNVANVEATYGIIKNIVLQDVNITRTSQETGSLIGLNTKGYIDNCFASGNINAKNWVGGLIGHNESGAIKSSTSNVNINATAHCVGGFIGHDTNGTIINCVSQGDVTSNSYYVGGLIGHETSNGSGYIYKCSTTSTVSGTSSQGAFIGCIDGGCVATVVMSEYTAGSTLNPVGNGSNNYTGVGNESSLTEGETRTVTTTNISIPSKNSMMSNIITACKKADTTVDENKLNIWLTQFYRENTNYSGGILVNEALKLASINYYLDKFIKTGEDSNIINSLLDDINNNSLTSTIDYQDQYVSTRDYEFTPYNSNSTDIAEKITSFDCGSYINIANNIYTALRKAGYTEINSTEDVAKIQSWVNAQYNNKDLEIAEINNYVTNYIDGNISNTSIINGIYTAINNNSLYSYPVGNKIYTDNTTRYVISFNEKSQSATMDWDMNNPDIVDALGFYENIKSGYIIVPNEKATDATWLSEIINSGIGMIYEIDENNNDNECMVSTDTRLQEVSDITILKKAEAKYEADMRKINAKDKKYDIELASLEAERNALKQEIDTLKTVVKDNVERTFKLFS